MSHRSIRSSRFQQSSSSSLRDGDHNTTSVHHADDNSHHINDQPPITTDLLPPCLSTNQEAQNGRGDHHHTAVNVDNRRRMQNSEVNADNTQNDEELMPVGGVGGDPSSLYGGQTTLSDAQDEDYYEASGGGGREQQERWARSLVHQNNNASSSAAAVHRAVSRTQEGFSYIGSTSLRAGAALQPPPPHHHYDNVDGGREGAVPLARTDDEDGDNEGGEAHPMPHSQLNNNNQPAPQLLPQPHTASLPRIHDMGGGTTIPPQGSSVTTTPRSGAIAKVGTYMYGLVEEEVRLKTMQLEEDERYTNAIDADGRRHSSSSTQRHNNDNGATAVVGGVIGVHNGSSLCVHNPKDTSAMCGDGEGRRKVEVGVDHHHGAALHYNTTTTTDPQKQQKQTPISASQQPPPQFIRHFRTTIFLTYEIGAVEERFMAVKYGPVVRRTWVVLALSTGGFLATSVSGFYIPFPANLLIVVTAWMLFFFALLELGLLIWQIYLVRLYKKICGIRLLKAYLHSTPSHATLTPLQLCFSSTTPAPTLQHQPDKHGGVNNKNITTSIPVQSWLLHLLLHGGVPPSSSPPAAMSVLARQDTEGVVTLGTDWLCHLPYLDRITPRKLWILGELSASLLQIAFIVLFTFGSRYNIEDCSRADVTLFPSTFYQRIAMCHFSVNPVTFIGGVLPLFTNRPRACISVPLNVVCFIIVAVLYTYTKGDTETDPTWLYMMVQILINLIGVVGLSYLRLVVEKQERRLFEALEAQSAISRTIATQQGELKRFVDELVPPAVRNHFRLDGIESSAEGSVATTTDSPHHQQPPQQSIISLLASSLPRSRNAAPNATIPLPTSKPALGNVGIPSWRLQLHGYIVKSCLPPSPPLLQFASEDPTTTTNTSFAALPPSSSTVDSAGDVLGDVALPLETFFTQGDMYPQLYQARALWARYASKSGSPFSSLAQTLHSAAETFLSYHDRLRGLMKIAVGSGEYVVEGMSAMSTLEARRDHIQEALRGSEGTSSSSSSQAARGDTPTTHLYSALQHISGGATIAATIEEAREELERLEGQLRTLRSFLSDVPRMRGLCEGGGGNNNNPLSSSIPPTSRLLIGGGYVRRECTLLLLSLEDVARFYQSNLPAAAAFAVATFHSVASSVVVRRRGGGGMSGGAGGGRIGRTSSANNISGDALLDGRNSQHPRRRHQRNETGSLPPVVPLSMLNGPVDHIGTLGDVFVIGINAITPCPHHAAVAIQVLQEVFEAVDRQSALCTIQPRAVIHSGPVVGVVTGYSHIRHTVTGPTLLDAQQMAQFTSSSQVEDTEVLISSATVQCLGTAGTPHPQSLVYRCVVNGGEGGGAYLEEVHIPNHHHNHQHRSSSSSPQPQTTTLFTDEGIPMKDLLWYSCVEVHLGTEDDHHNQHHHTHQPPHRNNHNNGAPSSGGGGESSNVFQDLTKVTSQDFTVPVDCVGVEGEALPSIANLDKTLNAVVDSQTALTPDQSKTGGQHTSSTLLRRRIFFLGAYSQFERPNTETVFMKQRLRWNRVPLAASEGVHISLVLVVLGVFLCEVFNNVPYFAPLVPATNLGGAFLFGHVPELYPNTNFTTAAGFMDYVRNEMSEADRDAIGALRFRHIAGIMVLVAGGILSLTHVAVALTEYSTRTWSSRGGKNGVGGGVGNNNNCSNSPDAEGVDSDGGAGNNNNNNVTSPILASSPLTMGSFGVRPALVAAVGDQDGSENPLSRNSISNLEDRHQPPTSPPSQCDIEVSPQSPPLLHSSILPVPIAVNYDDDVQKILTLARRERRKKAAVAAAVSPPYNDLSTSPGSMSPTSGGINNINSNKIYPVSVDMYHHPHDVDMNELEEEADDVNGVASGGTFSSDDDDDDDAHYYSRHGGGDFSSRFGGNNMMTAQSRKGGNNTATNRNGSFVVSSARRKSATFHAGGGLGVYPNADNTTTSNTKHRTNNSTNKSTSVRFVALTIIPILIHYSITIGISLLQPSTLANEHVYTLCLFVATFVFAHHPTHTLIPAFFFSVLGSYYLTTLVLGSVMRTMYILGTPVYAAVGCYGALMKEEQDRDAFAAIASQKLQARELVKQEKQRLVVLHSTVPRPLVAEFTKLRKACRMEQLRDGDSTIGTVEIGDVVCVSIRLDSLARLFPPFQSHKSARRGGGPIRRGGGGAIIIPTSTCGDEAPESSFFPSDDTPVPVRIKGSTMSRTEFSSSGFGQVQSPVGKPPGTILHQTGSFGEYVFDNNNNSTSSRNAAIAPIHYLHHMLEYSKRLVTQGRLSRGVDSSTTHNAPASNSGATPHLHNSRRRNQTPPTSPSTRPINPPLSSLPQSPSSPSAAASSSSTPHTAAYNEEFLSGLMSTYEVSSLMFAAIDSALQESQSTTTQPSLFFLKALGDSVTVGGPLVPSSNSARERIITDTFRFVTCLHRICQFLWASCPGGNSTPQQHPESGAAGVGAVVGSNPFSFSAAITCDHSITVLRNSLYPSVDVMGVAQYKAAMLTSSLPAPGMVVCTQAVGHIVKHLPPTLAALMPPQGHLYIQPQATMLRVRGLGCPQVHTVILSNDVLTSSSCTPPPSRDLVFSDGDVSKMRRGHQQGDAINISTATAAPITMRTLSHDDTVPPPSVSPARHEANEEVGDADNMGGGAFPHTDDHEDHHDDDDGGGDLTLTSNTGE